MCFFTNDRSSNSIASWFYKSLSFFLLCAPFLFPLPCVVNVHILWLHCKTWASAVVAGALFKLLFAWNVTQSVWRAGNIHPTVKSITMKQNSMLEHSVFWLNWLQGCFSPFITLFNGLKMSEYKVYWLTDFGALIAWHMHSKKEHSFSFTAVCTHLKIILGEDS